METLTRVGRGEAEKKQLQKLFWGGEQGTELWAEPWALLARDVPWLAEGDKSLSELRGGETELCVKMVIMKSSAHNRP